MRPKATPPALAELLDEELRLKCGTAMKALSIKPGKLAQKLDCDARDLGRWLKGTPRRNPSSNCALVRAACWRARDSGTHFAAWPGS